MANKEDPILDHEYDGIREFDNPIPAWWSWMWAGSCVFALAYYGYYEFGPGTSVHDAYVMEMEVVNAQRAEEAAEAAKTLSEENLAVLMGNAEAVAFGKGKYDTLCVACHGKSGEGLIGPNLTDMFFINGDGSLMAIHKVVKDGVIAKGMVPWGNTLPPEELSKVVAYVGSMRGKEVKGKAPQGDKYGL